MQFLIIFCETALNSQNRFARSSFFRLYAVAVSENALLAGFVQGTLIENQNHRHKCLDRLDNQLTRLLHELYSLARTKN